MIAYVTGTVGYIEENKVILDREGMGYNVFVPSTVSGSLKIKKQVRLYTYLNVKEDAMQLFGFLTQDDLQIFQLLLGVNGVGPKAALGILSVLSADELRFAVLADDANAIAKAPGVGKKSAQKVILELKDKMDLQDAFQKKTTNLHGGQSPLEQDSKSEVIQALIALGYGSSDALRAVQAVDDSDQMDVEELLKAALKKM